MIGDKNQHLTFLKVISFVVRPQLYLDHYKKFYTGPILVTGKWNLTPRNVKYYNLQCVTTKAASYTKCQTILWI